MRRIALTNSYVIADLTKFGSGRGRISAASSRLTHYRSTQNTTREVLSEDRKTPRVHLCLAHRRTESDSILRICRYFQFKFSRPASTCILHVSNGQFTNMSTSLWRWIAMDLKHEVDSTDHFSHSSHWEDERGELRACLLLVLKTNRWYYLEFKSRKEYLESSMNPPNRPISTWPAKNRFLTVYQTFEITDFSYRYFPSMNLWLLYHIRP